MKKLFLYIFIILFIASCSIQRMYNSMHGVYNKSQIDSICALEKLPIDFKSWIDIGLIDYETNDSINQYMFIKQLKNDEIIYNIIINDSLYIFSKRVTVK